MKKLVYLLLILTTIANLTAMQENSTQPRNHLALGAIRGLGKATEAARTSLEQQHPRENATSQRGFGNWQPELTHVEVEGEEEAQSEEEEELWNEEKLWKEEENDHKGSVTSTYKQHQEQTHSGYRPFAANEREKLDIQYKALKLYVFSKCAYFFGFASSSFALYVGVKNLFGQNGNKLTGTAQCLLGTAGIITALNANYHLNTLTLLTSLIKAS